MRILHTSDWHIGRSFHGHSTMDALAEVLAALTAQVREHAVDVVIVAGDVFDSATPAAPAYTLLGDTLAALHAEGARVIVTSGNHDSAARLGFAAGLLRDGIHLLTDPTQLAQPVTMADADGDVHFYGIPYLEPVIVRAHWPDVDPHQLRTQAQVLQHAMSLIGAHRAEHPGRSVVIAHTFAAGVEATVGLEREVRAHTALTQGGVDVVPLSTFDGIDYVALGHIHGRQALSDRVGYSGAPLHYSFGEQHKKRGSWLIDLDGDGAVSAQWLDLPVPRPLITLRGAFDDILSADNVAAYADHWVSAEYTDRLAQVEPMQRLKAQFPHCAHVIHAPEHTSESDGRTYAERAGAAVSDPERIDMFLAHVREGEGATEGEGALITDVLDEIRRAEVSR